MKRACMMVVLVCAGMAVAAAPLPIWDAAQYGTPAEVKAALAAGATANALDPSGLPPLMYALRNPDPAVLKTLLAAGADARFVKKDRGLVVDTPLMHAAALKDPAFAQLLLDAGADPKVETVLGDAAILSAAWNENVEVVRLFLKAKVRLNGFKDPNGTPSSVVSQAIAAQHWDVARALLDAGADPNAWGAVSVTSVLSPLGCAVHYDLPLDAYTLLLGAGAAVNAPVAPPTLNGWTITPLQEAAQHVTHPEGLLALIHAGADVNQRFTPGGVTPLQIAAALNQTPEICLTLLSQGARIDDVDAAGRTALMRAAAENYNPAVAAALLKAGANPSLRSAEGLTAYQYALKNQEFHDDAVLAALSAARGTRSLLEACRTGKTTEIQAALKNGASVREGNPNGETALSLAAEFAEPQGIALLVAAGADVNRRDGVDMSPLMIACIKNRPAAVVKALLAARPDVNAFYNAGMKLTSLHLAAQYAADPGVITALAAAGATVDARDFLQETPLMIAAERNPEPRVVQALLDAGADPAARDMARQTAFDHASKNTRLKGTRALATLQAGAAKAAAAAAAEEEAAEQQPASDQEPAPAEEPAPDEEAPAEDAGDSGGGGN